MARSHDPTAGAITLGRLLSLGTLVVLISLVFLSTDVRHRVAGYRAAHGHGIPGVVTVTRCASDLLGTVCTGDFTASDESAHRSHIRVNGPSGLARTALPVSYPAALADGHADEAWTVDGGPWSRPSPALLAALVPVALLLASFVSLLNGGPLAWLQLMGLLRGRHGQDRAAAHVEVVRRGRVH